MLDGFLELLRGGKAVIDGENLDGTFAAKHAIAIDSFSLTSESRSARRAAERMSEGLQEGDGVPTLSETTARSRPSGGSGKERRFTLNFQVTKPVDVASPPLFRAYCKHACLPPDDPDNRPIDLAKVTLRKAGGAKPLEYLLLQFTQVYVASYEVDARSGDKPPQETLSFTFKTMSIQYRPQKQQGQAAAKQTAWNFETPAT
jgi:type VI secretion system secreted protein Hcp